MRILLSEFGTQYAYTYAEVSEHHQLELDTHVWPLSREFLI